MRNDYYSYSKDYINRWVVSYADFITMLLALFMVLWAVSGMGQDKLNETNKKFQKVFTGKTVTTSAQTQAISKPSEQDLILKKLSKNKTIKIQTKLLKSERGAIIRLNNKMLFDQGSAIIRPEVLTTLDSIAAELKTMNNYVIIEGHTDSTPIKTSKYPSNWELSTARATNIINYLITKDKLNPKKLSAVGYGEYMPISSNTSNDGKIQNRRVDIIILSSDKHN